MRLRCAVGTIVVVVLLLPAQLFHGVEQGALAAQQMAARTVSAAIAQPVKVLRGNVSRNATLGTMLRDALSPAGVHRMVEASRPVYDLARITAGHPFGVTLGPDGLLAAFTYGIDELRTLRVIRDGEAFRAEVVTREYDTRVDAISGVITSSLFGAIEATGEQDQLAFDLAEIFAWDVDFNTELQNGDSFRVAVEKRFLDGRLSRYGDILAAELVRGDRVIQAVRFEGAAGVGYYMPDGRPMRKAFLRSPLRFTRISSGFTRARFHPILHRMRAHLGVDFAAPTGTAVRASGDGVVIGAGWQGGYGKVVRLRHANGYQTLYGHLSRISVRRGQRVTQGMIIGAVGSTGLSTGPHLDYRMTKNGVFLNPLKLKSPRAEPIASSEEDAFKAIRDRSLALLGPTPQTPMVATARADVVAPVVAIAGGASP